MIRKRSFAHVLKIEAGWPPAYARVAGTDGPSIVLTFRASGLLADTLRTAGPPFFDAEWGTRWGIKVIGMTLDQGVDWDEVAVLLTESYRLLAPKQLAAALRTPSPVRARAAGPGRSARRPPSRRTARPPDAHLRASSPRGGTRAVRAAMRGAR